MTKEQCINILEHILNYAENFMGDNTVIRDIRFSYSDVCDPDVDAVVPIAHLHLELSNGDDYYASVVGDSFPKTKG